MGFDIILSTCNLGTRTKRVKNRFTGELITTFDDPGLTAGERAAVAELLEELNAEGPDDFGVYRLTFADGGEADLFAPELTDGSKFDGCSVITRSLTVGVAGFLFRLSRCGNMVLTAVAEGVASLVTSEDQRERIAARYPDAKVIGSGLDLERELRTAFEAWRVYRDQIAGDEA